jgi:urease accessory protein
MAGAVCVCRRHGTCALAIGLPLVELGIVLSIVAIGGAAVLGARLPVAGAMALVGLFAIFHGHAHGTEMPQDSSGLAYGMGFMVATALLHGLGIIAGVGIARLAGGNGIAVARAGGGVMALAGIAILAGVL